MTIILICSLICLTYRDTYSQFELRLNSALMTNLPPHSSPRTNTERQMRALHAPLPSYPFKLDAGARAMQRGAGRPGQQGTREVRSPSPLFSLLTLALATMQAAPPQNPTHQPRPALPAPSSCGLPPPAPPTILDPPRARSNSVRRSCAGLQVPTVGSLPSPRLPRRLSRGPIRPALAHGRCSRGGHSALRLGSTVRGSGASAST